MDVVIGWAEVIYLALNILLLCAGFLFGKRAGEIGCAGVLWVCITLPLLYWGGFFS